jgi:hypothetical protein
MKVNKFVRLMLVLLCLSFPLNYAWAADNATQEGIVGQILSSVDQKGLKTNLYTDGFDYNIDYTWPVRGPIFPKKPYGVLKCAGTVPANNSGNINNNTFEYDIYFTDAVSGPDGRDVTKYLGAHAIYEKSEDMKDFDWAFGGTYAISHPKLTDIISSLFSLLPSTTAAVEQPPIFYFSTDFVTGLDNTANKSLRGDEFNALRFNLKLDYVKWGLFGPNDKLNFVYNPYYELAAPDAVVNSGKAATSYIMFSYETPIKEGGANFIIKYTFGSLPPDFNRSGGVISSGISVPFDSKPATKAGNS